MKRILLFIATNLAVLVVLSVSLRLLGIDNLLNEQGGISMTSLITFAAIVGMSGSFISLAMSKWMAKNMTGAQVIEHPANATEAWLVETVKRQAQRVGIGMPEVAIYDAPEPNAFATGMMRDNALVAVSTGLLRSLKQEEVEAVLAHEISHVANGDMVTLTLIQGVVNTFVIVFSRLIGHLVDRMVFRVERGYGPAFFITSLIAQLVLGILASMIVMWFSRYREFRADAGSAHLEGPTKMIAALQRLKLAQQGSLPSQMAAFGINSGERGGFARLFMSHPPLEERIEALQRWQGA